jgi:hypothetical protein
VQDRNRRRKNADILYFLLNFYVYLWEKTNKKHQNNPANSTPKLKFLGETLIFPTVHTYARTYRRPRWQLGAWLQRDSFLKAPLVAFFVEVLYVEEKNERAGWRKNEWWEVQQYIYINHMPSVFRCRSMNTRVLSCPSTTLLSAFDEQVLHWWWTEGQVNIA